MVNAGISAAGFVHQMPEGVGERIVVPPIAGREFEKFVPEFEARARADIERRGAHAVSAPIGAGGQADREAEGT
jgi:hypothetical protein